LCKPEASTKLLIISTAIGLVVPMLAILFVKTTRFRSA